jgi:hypothetical protein
MAADSAATRIKAICRLSNTVVLTIRPAFVAAVEARHVNILPIWILVANMLVAGVDDRVILELP